MVKKHLGDASQSKLANRSAEADDTPEAPRLTSSRRPKMKLTSFRFESADHARIQQLATRVSDEAGRKVGRSDLLRGLILLGEKTDVKRMLTMIKDAKFEGS